NQIDQAGLTAFVNEIKAMGLEFMVTELDVVDNKMPGPPDMRDMVAAARVHDFLGAIFAVMKPSAVLTWGIT
ncbi:endo-1,4-beta-xylanase, partial [Stenotrophomonas maltophilia]|uniref:endo-1,4-beta-xylanase n=1 Tax=Stenotrophomonas maltophilia TaxID=40324 RepID=UPI0013DB0646